MFEAAEETIVVCDDADENETRSTFGEADDSGTISSMADTVSSDYHWELIAIGLQAITAELGLLEEYFMKAAGSVDIGELKTEERQKLLDLYKELNKLAQVLKIGYNSRKLVSRRDFESELKTLKDEFVFMLRQLPPSPRMFLEAPELISEQLNIAAGVIRDVKRILTAHFSEKLCWRDVVEQMAAIILYVFDTSSDWYAAYVYFKDFGKYGWRFILALVFVHFAACRTACIYVGSILLIPVFTVLPFLPVQVLGRQLHMCFKFRRKPNEIRFKEMIRYHSLREDSIIIYSSGTLLRALPQLILQGHTLVDVLLLDASSGSHKKLIFSWVTSLVNLCYACSKRSLFEFTSSSRFVSLSYFSFFLFYEFSRVTSLIMMLVCARWWFSAIASFLRFQISLVWLCRRINSSYNVHLSFMRRIVSSSKGSVILTSIPMLCYWSGFPQFWMNALDVFGCLTLSALWADSVQNPQYMVSIVASVIMSWFIACTIAWSTASLSRMFFGSPSEEML